MIKKYLDFTGLTELVEKIKSMFQKKEFLGTKDEWDNLSSSEKAKYEIVNFTDDLGCAYQDIYSTTEVKTNKVWIDGRAIYRRTVVKTIDTYTDGGSGNSRRSFALEKTDISDSLDIILSCNGFVDNIVGTGTGRPSHITIPNTAFYGYGGSTSANYTAFAGKESVSVSTNVAYEITSIKVTATLEYVKTTDV